MPASPEPFAPDPNPEEEDMEPPDPSATLTRRFQEMDQRLERKHAAAEEQLKRSRGAVRAFKECAEDTKSKLCIREFAQADLDKDPEDRRD